MSYPGLDAFRNVVPAAERQALDQGTAELTQWLAAAHSPEGQHLAPWTLVPFAATKFTGTAGWTVANPSVKRYAYWQFGKAVTLAFWLSGTTVTGGAGSLTLAIPDGLKVATSAGAPFAYLDNGTAGTGIALVTPGAVTIDLRKTLSGAVNWAASAAATDVCGQLVFEVS